MNYQQAKDTIEDAGLYASPDFYRMQFADSIALGIQDSAARILVDAMQHGSDESRVMFAGAMEKGYIAECTEEGITYHDVVIEGDQYFKRHMAMQIAFPSLYKDFFGGHNIWDPDHSRLRELLELTISCLTNKLHPSDYYGQHEIADPDAPAKKGRPSSVKAPKKLNLRFQDWVKACQEYKAQLSDAWDDYIRACNERKVMETKAKAWRDGELDRLRSEMALVSQQYEVGMKSYVDKINSAKQKHAALKASGKPRRAEYE
jgi:hypothetical protein